MKKSIIDQIDNESARKLIGKKILQVCFGLYQVILNFDEKISIQIYDNAELYDNSEFHSRWNYRIKNDAFSLNCILEDTITDCIISDDFIELFFENKCSLKIYNGHDGYESMIFAIGTDYFVIY